MNWIKKYSFPIIVALAFILACKSCQSCSRQRTIERERIEHVAELDSIKNLYIESVEHVRSLEDSIQMVELELEQVRLRNSDMIRTIEDSRTTIGVLTSTNHNLSKKQTSK